MTDFSLYDKSRSFPEKMTPEETFAALKSISPKNGDEEVMHALADEALCALLRFLGHGDVVDAWDAIPKWYA